MNQTRRLFFLSAAWIAAAPAFAAHKKAHKQAAAAANGAVTPGDDEGEGADSSASPANTLIGPVDTVARWAVAVDYNTGATLLDKDADVQMPPSSMTKLLTAYVVFTSLKSGKLSLDQTLPVSENAWRTGGAKTGGSTMFLDLNSNVKVEDLIRGMIVQSGNDACIVLAEGIAGSESAFVDQMNQTAKKLGLNHSHFVNSSGLPDANHYMSVRDIATLAAHLIRDFPEYYHYDSEKSFTYNNIHQDNRNPLVLNGTADGLKTGHTEAGGYGLCASAERNGRRVIVVLNGMGSRKQRSSEGERIMDWSFANFQDVNVVKNGQLIDHAAVWLGTAPDVPMVASRDLILTMPNDWRDHIKGSVSYAQPVNAPVAMGAKIGELSLSFPGYNMLPQQIDLIAGNDVPELGFGGRAEARIKSMLGHKG